MKTRLCNIRAATWMAMETENVFASAWDGMRLGNPAEECCVHVLASVKGEFATVHPPAVPWAVVEP